MLVVNIIVPGPPVPKGRPRFGIVQGRARAFTPLPTRRYEDLIRLEAGKVMERRDHLVGPLSVNVSAYMAMPMSLWRSAVKRESALAGHLRPLTKPDVDNFAKVIDALNGIVWRDDSQVVELSVAKFYSDRPRLELSAREL